MSSYNTIACMTEGLEYLNSEMWTSNVSREVDLLLSKVVSFAVFLYSFVHLAFCSVSTNPLNAPLLDCWHETVTVCSTPNDWLPTVSTAMLLLLCDRKFIDPAAIHPCSLHCTSTLHWRSYHALILYRTSAFRATCTFYNIPCNPLFISLCLLFISPGKPIVCKVRLHSFNLTQAHCVKNLITYLIARIK